MINKKVKCDKCGNFTDIKRYHYTKDMKLLDSYYFCSKCQFPVGNEPRFYPVDFQYEPISQDRKERTINLLRYIDSQIRKYNAQH